MISQETLDKAADAAERTHENWGGWEDVVRAVLEAVAEYQWGCQIGGLIYPHDDEEGARRDAAYKSKPDRQVVRRLKAGPWEVAPQV